jgi:hypothetical protein
MRYLLITFTLFILVGIAGGKAHANEADQFSNYPPQFAAVIESIHRLPEARELIKRTQQEGEIKVAINTTIAGSFDAYWEANSRTILVNAQKNRSKGSLICSILFELHNASTDTTLSRLIERASRGEIDKETYVQAVEQMEHTNALNTIALLKKGVAKGIFPSNTRWPIFYNFINHYQVQQLQGHSQWLAAQYDQIAPKGTSRHPFKGTIPHLEHLNEQDKRDLLLYLSYKDNLSDPSIEVTQEGMWLIQAEWQQLNRTTGTEFSRTQRKRYLLALIFNTIDRAGA